MFSKILTSLAALALVFGAWGSAYAAVVETTETDDILNAVGEVTDSLLISAEGTVRIFTQGVAYVLTANLQREIGSPGSGAWENVLVVTGATGVERSDTYTNGPSPANYRVAVTAYTSGSVTSQLTDNAATPFDFGNTRGNRTYIHWFEDFYDDEALLTAATTVWKGVLLTDEDAAGGTICVITAATNEGVLTCVSGTAGSAADTVHVHQGVVTNTGSLVSDGRQMFETRIQYDDLTGSQVTMALVDVATGAESDEPFDFTASDVGTFGTAIYADALGIIMDDDTGDNFFQPFGGLTDVELNDSDAGGAGEEFAMGATFAINTYRVLRVEVDSAGDCYFFVDSALEYAHNQCVNTTAVMMPAIFVGTSAIANDATTIIIDYMWFAFARPA